MEQVWKVAQCLISVQLFMGFALLEQYSCQKHTSCVLNEFPCLAPWLHWQHFEGYIVNEVDCKCQRLSAWMQVWQNMSMRAEKKSTGQNAHYTFKSYSPTPTPGFLLLTIVVGFYILLRTYCNTLSLHLAGLQESAFSGFVFHACGIYVNTCRALCLFRWDVAWWISPPWNTVSHAQYPPFCIIAGGHPAEARKHLCVQSRIPRWNAAGLWCANIEIFPRLQNIAKWTWEPPTAWAAKRGQGGAIHQLLPDVCRCRGADIQHSTV